MIFALVDIDVGEEVTVDYQVCIHLALVFLVKINLFFVLFIFLNRCPLTERMFPTACADVEQNSAEELTSSDMFQSIQLPC